MSGEMGGGQEALRKSYSYVRTAMVAMLVGLAVAVLFQTERQGFVLASVSAYYYTPAQAIFVGALIGLGACMIALRGTNEVEEIFLNLGGMFAPIVAIVPTSRGEDYRTAVRACREEAGPLLSDRAASAFDCPTIAALESATRANVENNMFALLVLGLLGLVATVVIAKVSRTAPKAGFWWGLATAFALWAAGGLVFWRSQAWFLDNAHLIAAVGLAACITVVVAANAFRREREQSGETRPSGSNFYVWITVIMVATIAVMGVLMMFEAVTLFWLEIVVAGLFIVFWVVQTVERARA